MKPYPFLDPPITGDEIVEYADSSMRLLLRRHDRGTITKSLLIVTGEYLPDICILREE